MKCPNCGAEMADDTLYCETCGEDIHIVPDFEPEVEYSIEKTINRIAEDIKEQELTDPEAADAPAEEPSQYDYGDSEKKGIRKWRNVLILLTSVGAICIIALLLAVGIQTAMYYSPDYQLERARQYASLGQYDRAITYYDRALELAGGDDVSLKMELADTYYAKNNKIEYEYLLREIVRDKNTDAELMESAYGKLIAIYRDRGDYQTINELLIASNNENIMTSYQSYLALAPEFSITEGYYTSIQPLKLTALSAGKIYYTLDGETPTADSSQYTAPILLENGDYTVSAVFINDNGVQSDIVTKEYHIEVEELPEPEVVTVNGSYQFPVNIEIEGDIDDIYYTTDGSVPTENATPYTAPIPMPLGKSTYRFVRITEGRTSQVVEKTYQLELNTEITWSNAEEILTQYAMEQGKIYDMDGHFDDTRARYVYQYQYVTNINQVDDFYVLAEILVDAEGHPARTGSFYAVNAYTGVFYRLTISDNRRYELFPMENSNIENVE